MKGTQHWKTFKEFFTKGLDDYSESPYTDHNKARNAQQGHHMRAANMNTTQAQQIEFVKVKHDVNGNPRYVCHFLYLNTEAELNASGNEWIPVSEKYEIALKRAKAIGGKKYHTKGFGGGIVFQSYNLDEEVDAIARVTGIHYTGYVCK